MNRRARARRRTAPRAIAPAPAPASVAVAAALGVITMAACTPGTDARSAADGVPVAVDLPQGWEEGAPAEEEAQQADPVVYTAGPGDGADGGLYVQAFEGRVSTVEAGVGIARAAQEARWSGYSDGAPAEIEVDGADAARRIDYTYACGDGDGDDDGDEAGNGGRCAGAAFVLHRDRDMYLVRLSWREGAEPEGGPDRLQGSLALL
ncbi:hypothetical protein O4J56_10500 [Nocardiopsis sp. RSe5-2]|uniref:Lipoprotein n=1 Tax=Nocardiopsis endophytica TaxID=3018445 RepID=A0ABT4U299_9ACTN|nr:hypothetical protein [Nocardiopsis endophytica]MDA2811066.1 hypothetical protein [Nocardiopsis endophytica]